MAGFYFGSTSVSSAIAAERAAAPSQPTIESIKPAEAKKGDTVAIDIAGADFRSPTTLRLIRGSEVMMGMDLTWNPKMIHCKIVVDKDPGGKWDVVAQNVDGQEARLSEAFTIKESVETPQEHAQ